MLKRSARRAKPYKELRNKPPTEPKKRKPLNPRGKSNRSKERASWQREMMETYGPGERCEVEGCSDTFGVANAHRLKKTKITTREEYVHGRAHLCGRHHRALDEATGPDVHKRMYDFITDLIERRK